MGCGVVEITNPSSFSCVLTDSYLAAGGDVQPTGQNSQRCGRAMARRCQNARCRIYMWSCRKADKYGGKNSTVIKTEMQSWINAQCRHCADPRLDHTRDASLKHQRKHGAARKQLRSTLWIFFSLFFWWRFFLRSFQRKITIMGSVSKYFSSLENRTGTKFFRNFFFRLFGSKIWISVAKSCYDGKCLKTRF